MERFTKRGLCLCALLLAGCGDVKTRQPAAGLFTAAPVEAGLAPEAPVAGMPAPRRLVVSGHSLVDRPFPDQVAALAARAGTPLEWQQVYLFGSSIKDRGTELIPPQPWDALLITEQHTLLGNLMWNDTQRHLREWADAVHAMNPGAVAYFYMPWLTIDDKADPARWIAYEQGAALVWQCMVTRANQQLAAEGDARRIVTLPANLALAYLVEQVAGGATVPGLSADPREAIDQLVADDVHLTPLGSFYIALVSYMGMGGLGAQALAPLLETPVAAQVSVEQAQSLLQVAAGFQASRAERRVVLDPQGCRRYLGDSFIEDYWRYVRATLRPQVGMLRAAWSTWRGKHQSRGFFSGW